MPPFDRAWDFLGDLSGDLYRLSLRMLVARAVDAHWVNGAMPVNNLKKVVRYDSDPLPRPLKNSVLLKEFPSWNPTIVMPY
jgi:hypothetical protein